MSIIKYANLSLACILGLCLMCCKSEDSNTAPLIEICGDGIDNDDDGFIDCEDGECEDFVDCQIERCKDGVDNDGDGLIDCEDPDCDSNPSCQ